MNTWRERTNDGREGDLRACKEEIYDIAQFVDLSKQIARSLHHSLRLNLSAWNRLIHTQCRDISITISVFQDSRKIVYQLDPYVEIHGVTYEIIAKRRGYALVEESQTIA